MSKTSGDVTGEALATAEQFGKLGCHIQQVLEDICRELGQGAIAADPFWRGPDKNACRYCDYAAACHFEEGRGGRLPPVGPQAGCGGVLDPGGRRQKA